MASKNVMVGTGAALAGLGGLAIAAVTADHPDTRPAPTTKAAAPVVETQTVIVRKVEHRVIHLKPKHPKVHTISAARAAPAVAAPAPVVQAAPVPGARTVTPVRTRTSGTHAPAPTTAPIRTRTSGGAGRGGGEHESGDGGGGADD